ncbi:DUF6745 domain-containing protein [Kitasatospora viridis]|uniref:DUF6745 domain-containing protein n=1 Tax=Kitasatospora viridis TaxID=281105 RepID=A0A561UQ87_9ACTN|nr:hypothetical protein [Kitasatospora viridis]TWG01511.1 hypothetical protein FHX73_115412 [Kitasatospora viridis]
MTATQQAGPRPGADAVRDWRTVGAATGPADRARAERAVLAAYRAAGVVEEPAVLWFDSPLQAAAAALHLTGRADKLRGCPGWDQVARLPELPEAGRSVREQVRTAPWERARRRAHQRLGPLGWSALWSVTGGELWPTGQALADRIRAGVAERLHGDRQSAVGPVRQVLLDAVLGQHDAAWLAAFDAAGEVDAGLAPLAELSRSAGWWWPYERLVLLCERPTELHRDEAGRLDRPDGPALAYPDGFALHAWHGMPVPADFLANLGDLTPARIREEENAELRRVMLEHYGYDRYLADSAAEPLHRDETGVLWRIQLDDDEPVVMVEVVNSTAEPDGSFRTYWLRVPPTTGTAREGVAWTFGLTADQYRPQRET